MARRGDRGSLFLAQDRILDLVDQVLLVGLLGLVVGHGAAILLGLLCGFGLARVGLEDIAGTTPTAVLRGTALSALDPAAAVSFGEISKGS